MLARRSALSVPGASEKMLAKAPGLPADEVVLDLEDSVTPDTKDEARRAVVAFLANRAADGPAVAVRVNAPDTAWFEEDVVALAGSGVDSIVVPKVESAEQLAQFEAAQVPLQALIETAAGLQHAGEIAAAPARVESLILGYADLAASLGRMAGRDTPERWLYAQETVLVAARAAGVQAIDGPYLQIRDQAGLARWAEHVRDLGYDGKWAVHPDQLGTINEVFTPSPEEFERARAIVAALEQAGAAELNGEMIDEASRKHARLVVARGEAAER